MRVKLFASVMEIALILCVLGLTLVSASEAVNSGLWNTAVTARATKPNIIFILTDDQDYHMNSLDYMKGVQTHLVNEGRSCGALFVLVINIPTFVRFSKEPCIKNIIVPFPSAVRLESTCGQVEPRITRM